MKEAGIVAVSDDGKPIATARLARQVMEYCRSLDLPVIEHSEDVSLAAGAVMREGVTSTRLGLRGMCPPLTITACAPISTSLRAACSIAATSLISIPVSTSASGTFGVITFDRFKSSVAIYFTPPASSNSVPLDDFITGS